MDDLLLELKEIGPAGIAYIIFHLMEEDGEFWGPFCRDIIQLFDVNFGLSMMAEYSFLLEQKYCNWVH